MKLIILYYLQPLPFTLAMIEFYGFQFNPYRTNVENKVSS